MTGAVLLRAHCAAGHDWDVWGELDEAERPHVAREELRCPTCWPPAPARRIEIPESLA